MTDDSMSATLNRIQCSICDGIFYRESDGELFCLLCLKLWLEDKGVIECINCHRRKENTTSCSLKTLSCRKATYDQIDYAFDFGIGSGIASEVCITHNEPHLYYCCTCRKAICKTCLTYTHEQQGHDIKSVQDMCPDQKRFTGEMCDVLKRRLELEVGYINNIDECLKEITECVSAAEHEINQIVAQRIDIIKTNGDLLKKQLKEIRMAKSASFREEKARAVLLAKNMEKALIDAHKSVSDYPDYVYAAKHEDINENMLKLCIEQQHQQHVLSGTIRFVPNPIVPGHDDPHLGNFLYRRSLRRETTFGEFKHITAIAGCPDGHLAIFDKSTKDVVVYNLLREQGEICQVCMISDYDDGNQVRDASTDVVFTSMGNLLLSNREGNIAEFDLRTSAYKEHITLSSAIARRRRRLKHLHVGLPYKFGVTSGTEIIVGTKLNQIHVLDSVGKLLRTFKVEISPRDHLATNGREIAFTNSKCGKLCVLNLHTGVTLWTTDIPGVQGVCFDDKSGSILITRNTLNDAGVIEQYCSSTGAFIGRLADEIERPDDLTLLRGDLIAVSNKTYIQIFSIQ